jgi:hypothetical protein
MSCGCGKLPKGTFSSQRDTWSTRSDLDMARWDPYPELQNPKNCYGTNLPAEPYCNCSMKDCGLFLIEPNLLDANYAPLQHPVEPYCNAGGMSNCAVYKVEQDKIDSNYPLLQRSVIFQANPVRELYTSPCCRPTPYNNLDNTWGNQKPYNL